MVKEEYKVGLINFDDKGEEVMELRNLSWRINPTEHSIGAEHISDEFDLRCFHLVIYCGEKMVSAARMLITPDLNELNYSKHFGPKTLKSLKGKLGSITRVVVHPDYRLNGLAVKIMNELEDEARKRGVSTLLGYPADWSMKLMKICKYELVENLGDMIKELPGFNHYLMKKELV